MAEDNSSIQVLLECSSLNNTIPYFIGEEIVCSLPDDIEVIQLNNLPETDFNKLSPPIKLLPPKKQSPPKAKRKRINSVKANAKASKIQSLITLPEPAKDSFIDFCGLKVPVKTLLQNPDIRKQLEPFIEEIIISDVSDTSDVEEIGKTQRKNVPQDAKERKQPVKPRSKKRKKSLEPTVQEGNGPFVEVLIPEADSNELIEEDIIVNLPLAIEKDAIKDTQKMYVLEEQIQLVTDSSDDEFIVDQNNGIQEKQILLKNVNDTHKSQSSNTVLKKSKNNTKDIPNNEVVVLDDVLKENVKKKDNNSDIDKVQEAPLMESDDWYYLNLANTSKLNENSIILNADDSIKEMSTKKDNEKNENNSVVEKNIQLNQVLPNQESEVEKPVRRKRKKRRRIPWSRHAIRGTRTLKNVKAQLQGKIVKGGVKNVQSETENTTAESHVIRKKAENADTLSVKEIINNAPKTSVLDKNINQDSACKNGLLPVLQKTSLDSNELTIKQEEPILKNDDTIEELPTVNQLNKEIDENKIRIKLEQEVSWNTDVDYQNMYLQENRSKEQSVEQQQMQRMSTRQKQSRLIAKRSFFGQRRMIGKCDNCGKRYERLGALRRHQLICKVNYECAMCTFVTSDKIAFREHLANHILGSVNIDQEEKPINDADNNQVENSPTHTEDFTTVEDQNKSEKSLGYTECYRCKICENMFDDYTSLRKHIVMSLQGVQAAQLQKDTDKCNRCGANSFKTKCELRIHLMSKCKFKKAMLIPYVKLERCKIPEKSTKEVQYEANSYCPKCLTTSPILEKGTKCDKCKSKLSFICEICRNLSITYGDLRTHMTCAHNINLNNSTYKRKVPEEKCLSVEEKDTIKDLTGNTKSPKALLQYKCINNATTDNSKSMLKTDTMVDNSQTSKHVVHINEKSNKSNTSCSKSKKVPVPVIKNTQLNKKVDQNQKHEPEMPKAIKTIKTISPIKKNCKNSIEKEVEDIESPEESYSENSTEKYLNLYAMYKAENNRITDKIKDKTLNRKIKSSIMGLQKQYFSKENGAFEKIEFKNTHLKSLKRMKSELTNQMNRFCIKCDKSKKYYEIIKMGLIKEICRKCKLQLLYQCGNCHGICKDYNKMAWHVIHKCKPRLRFFSVSHKSHLRKILERRYALLEAQQNIFDSIAF